MPLRLVVANIREKIDIARKNSPLAADQITLLAASKAQTADTIAKAVAAGIMVFGENRVQEAEAKWPELKKRFPDIELHLIGPLQTNKVKQSLQLFDVIQTIDRHKLADAIAMELQKSEYLPKQFYIQVNIGKEPQKAGVMPEEADSLIGYCIKDLHLPVAGLMCVPPSDQLPAPYFALLREIALRNGLSKLSMGMSEDYETAVRMGATCVRLGRVLFGEHSRTSQVSDEVRT
jgi:pyridoxal phosphate enzyme (YggS family)